MFATGVTIVICAMSVAIIIITLKANRRRAAAAHEMEEGDDDDKTICSDSSDIIEIEMMKGDDRDCPLMHISQEISLNNDDDCTITSIGSNNNDEEEVLPSDIIVEVV